MGKRREHGGKNEKENQYMEPACENNPGYGKEKCFIFGFDCDVECIPCNVRRVFGIVDEMCR